MSHSSASGVASVYSTKTTDGLRGLVHLVSFGTSPQTPFDDDVATLPQQIDRQRQLESFDRTACRLVSQVDAGDAHPIVRTHPNGGK
jgi:hypothetical protein